MSRGRDLPATRVLTSQLEVSRNTILTAFDQLIAEGYLVGRLGSGIYVADLPPEMHLEVKATTLPAAEQATAPLVNPRLSSRTAALEHIPLRKLHTRGQPRPFRPSPPDAREFPLAIWERLRSRELRHHSTDLFNYGEPAGYAPLRQALTHYLRDARGVKCEPEQILITAGSQQALQLIANVLLSPGDLAGVEEPGYYGAKAAFLHAGARLLPLLVDEDGLIVPDSRRNNPPVLLYATPSHQFPLGATMTLARRMALLDFARHTGAWIVEDDYDSEYRYEGRPLASLQGLDQHGYVLYVGTLSKVLFPSLRLGYMVLPPKLVDPFIKAKAIADGQSPLIEQATLRAFIDEGHFARHLRRMRLLYGGRLNALRESVVTRLDGVVRLEPAQAGLNVVGWLENGFDEEQLSTSALKLGIELPGLGSYGHTALTRPGVVFGFAAFAEEQIRSAVQKLAFGLEAFPRNRSMAATTSGTPE